ncbi:hypothetical protein [Fortiea sp. LEGE XX443]|nr:hypothetical protein [Fortiea sp. LEGE XX443]
MKSTELVKGNSAIPYCLFDFEFCFSKDAIASGGRLRHRQKLIKF